MLLDVATNFTSPLVRVAVDSSCRPGHQVAIPFAEGLLLGSIEANFHEEGQGPSFQTVTRSGISPMTMLDCPYLISAQRRCTLKISIHTFVGAHDLFPNQCVIRDSLTAFGSHHRGAMQAIRTALFRGFPDPRMIQRFGAIADGLAPEDFDKLAETMQNFFDTAEWKQQAEAHMRTERYVH